MLWDEFGKEYLNKITDSNIDELHKMIEEKLVMSDMKFKDDFINVFVNNKQNYDAHKNSFLTFINSIICSPFYK